MTRTPRVFVDTALAPGAEIELARDRSHYLRNVLRLSADASVLLFNGSEATDYRARLRYEGKAVRAIIEAATPNKTESKLQSTIVQGLGRADHVDWTVQKTTELGVSRILLFNAARTQSPLRPAQLQKKRAHWRAVAASACEQCGRAIVPAIDFFPQLEEALAATPAGLRLLLDFDGPGLAARLRSAEAAVAILLGPEGGLDEAEVAAATAAGYAPARLGPRVLRTETAAAAALALVQSGLGDLN